LKLKRDLRKCYTTRYRKDLGQGRDKLEKKKEEINKYISTVLDGRLDSMNHGYILLILALL
jgi:hypothetical protein